MTPPSNLHLTLLFLGEVSAERLAAIQLVAAEAARRTPSFPVRFDHLESWQQARAVVACTSTIPFALHALLAALRAAVESTPSDELFRPHVTLARSVIATSAMPKIDALSWSARSICLVRSDRHARGSVYTVVDSWSLLDNAASH